MFNSKKKANYPLDWTILFPEYWYILYFVLCIYIFQVWLWYCSWASPLYNVLADWTHLQSVTVVDAATIKRISDFLCNLTTIRGRKLLHLSHVVLVQLCSVLHLFFQLFTTASTTWAPCTGGIFSFIIHRPKNLCHLHCWLFFPNSWRNIIFTPLLNALHIHISK